ncbi:MAG: hypothetical protein L0K86_11655 [Actinomycetia bacterium]|nr:hypothetical protein [Actinomycetes bacterium]
MARSYWCRSTDEPRGTHPLAEIRLESELRRLLRLLAARTANELVVTAVAGDAEITGWGATTSSVSSWLLSR